MTLGKKKTKQNIEQFVLEDTGNVDSAQHGAFHLSELISFQGSPAHFQMKTTMVGWRC